MLPDIVEDITYWRGEDLEDLADHGTLQSDLLALRTMMTNDVGLVKSDSRLENAREKIAQIRADVVSEWIIKGAFIKDAAFGDMNWDDDTTVMNISLTIGMDYCVLNF